MANFQQGSRFLGGRIGKTFNDTTVVFPKFIDYTSLKPVSFIVISANNAFRDDLISLEAYDRPDLGWHIMAFNFIDHPKDLKAGLTLKVPPVRGVVI